MFVICEECRKPRLLHSQRKLRPEDPIHLEALLESVLYSCGADIHDIDVDKVSDTVLSKVLFELILFAKQPSKFHIIQFGMTVFVSTVVVTMVSKSGMASIQFA